MTKNTFEILRKVVAGVSGKPGWVFRLIDDDEGLRLRITDTEAVDAYNPGSPFSLNHYFPVPTTTWTEACWRRWVHSCAMGLETHEVGEWLRWGEDRPFAPLHGPGEDPYVVHEFRPETDARTTQSGALRACVVVLLFLFALAAATPTHAMDHGWDNNSPHAKWVGSLLRPDRKPGTDWSCCGKGDMYGIRIEQDAIGDEGDAMGTAVVTDGDPIKFPDGTTRPEIKNGTVFRFPKSKVNPLADGNPTATAHAFLSTLLGGTQINMIYCVIPLPPGM